MLGLNRGSGARRVPAPSPRHSEPFELGELEHGERTVERRHRVACEEAAHRAARAPRPQSGRHVGGAAVVAGLEESPHRAEVGAVAALVPGARDGLVDERGLDVVDASPAPRHPPDDAREHGEALLAVVAVMRRGRGVDHGEGVQAPRAGRCRPTPSGRCARTSPSTARGARRAARRRCRRARRPSPRSSTRWRRSAPRRRCAATWRASPRRIGRHPHGRHPARRAVEDHRDGQPLRRAAPCTAKRSRDARATATSRVSAKWRIISDIPQASAAVRPPRAAARGGFPQKVIASQFRPCPNGRRRGVGRARNARRVPRAGKIPLQATG